MAIMDAMRHGHELICAANISPMESLACEQGGDVDSYTFQTVGHEAVPLVAACLGVPLRRASIGRHQSVIQTMSYPDATDTSAVNDEVEVMASLLASIKAEFPEVQAVCCGAIQSNYQRLRVEAVCRRLQLQSLAYLWQRPFDDMFTMCEAYHVEAIFVKVASIGLSPKSVLGSSFTALREKLMKLHDQFGVHPLGEGGEFETIVLDCPIFKKQRLAIVTSTVHAEEDSDYASRGYLHAVFQLVDKSGEEELADRSVLDGLGLISLRSDVMGPVRGLLETSRRTTICPEDLMVSGNKGQLLLPVELPSSRQARRDPLSSHRGEWRGVRLRDVVADAHEAELAAKFPLADQARRLFQGVVELFREQNRSIFFMVIFCPTMKAYADVNKSFALVVRNIPARAFLESSDLCEIIIDVFFCRNDDTTVSTPTCRWKSSLRVESISCWAAATIGPYAQAVELDESSGIGDDDDEKCVRSVFVSGRIGMVPSSLDLATSGSANVAVANPSTAAGGAFFVDEQSAKSFVNEFSFTYANSIASLEHYGMSAKHIISVTFFLRDPRLIALLPGLWHLCSRGESSVVATRSESEVGVEGPFGNGICCARVIIVTAMPKGASVEMFCNAAISNR